MRDQSTVPYTHTHTHKLQTKKRLTLFLPSSGLDDYGVLHDVLQVHRHSDGRSTLVKLRIAHRRKGAPAASVMQLHVHNLYVEVRGQTSAPPPRLTMIKFIAQKQNVHTVLGGCYGG